MIKNRNDFLGFLIRIKNMENNVSINDAIEASGLTNLDFSELVNQILESHYAIQTDLNTLHLFPWGIAAYTPKWKRISLWFLKLCVLTVKNLILYIGGILSGIIVAYATFLINEML